MVGGSRTSTSDNRRRRPHRSDSQRTSPRSVDTISDQYKPADQPDVNQLRRARAEFYDKSPEDRRREGQRQAQREVQREMEYQASRRRSSKGKQPSVRLPEVMIREERRKHDSERRHRRRKPKEEVRGGDGYVYRYLDDDQGSKAPERPRRQRSTTTAIPRDKPERVRANSASIPRSTGRKASYQREEANRSVRTERRPSSVVLTSVRTHRPISKSASVRETRAASASGSSLKRSQTTTRKARRSSFSLSIPPIAEERPERKPSSAKKNDRNPGFLGSIFGVPKPVEPVPEKQVECLTCLSDVPISKSAKLACQHSMCHSCLRRIFNLSVTDPQHMPPKCCTQDHIPLKHVDKLFDLRFKKKWNQKYQEYTTKNRIYCPAKGCGEWIKPANIYIDTSSGRKYGKCNRCRTKVCTACNCKWHTSRECPKDEATQRFAEIAKEEGWQRCFNCSATVELREGCNHMTCRCGAEFCMICGLRWRSCDCPWFTYAAVEADRLLHMNVPRRVPPGQEMGNPALGYQEELDRRREQERRDEALARRMQTLGFNGVTNDPLPNFYPHPVPHHPPFPNHAPNHDFVRRTADILSPPYNPIHADRFNPRAPPHPNHTHTDRFVPPPTPPNPMADIRQQPPLRHHSVANRLYNDRPQPRASQQILLGMQNYESRPVRPHPFAGGGDGGAVPGQGVGVGRRHSTLAGLTSGTAEGRVDEWRRHVGDD